MDLKPIEALPLAAADYHHFAHLLGRVLSVDVLAQILFDLAVIESGDDEAVNDVEIAGAANLQRDIVRWRPDAHLLMVRNEAKHEGDEFLEIECDGCGKVVSELHHAGDLALCVDCWDCNAGGVVTVECDGCGDASAEPLAPCRACGRGCGS